ncbi:hypothetical protein [Ascidiaceihabitans sp.]|uniref:hypothetical protein n=1 Tax=Ascidiaceihabitans sp. TaxID=1872644 RepID=UPI0032994006
MSVGLTRSEKFVTQLCERSFLELWTHPNPIGKKGKELCDCLIVCGPHIVIISVKEIEYKDTGDTKGWERWHRTAIEKSASQIWGAERWLKNADDVVRHDGRIVTLPPKLERIYHRVSVSLGSKEQAPIKWGDLGNGFVHVCDEKSVGIVFSALDTITDFVEFLTASEAFVTGEAKVVFNGGGIEDLVALFIQNDYTFPNFAGGASEAGLMILDGDIWDSFEKSEEFKDHAEYFKNSYRWDSLIKSYAKDLITDGMLDMHSQSVTHDQHALIEMALQPRYMRAQLSGRFFEILGNPELKVRSRLALGYGGTAFVFLIAPSSDREARVSELGLRCLVVQCKQPDTQRVVGIATDQPGSSKVGYSSDLAYIELPDITQEMSDKAVEIQRDLSYFPSL